MQRCVLVSYGGRGRSSGRDGPPPWRGSIYVGSTGVYIRGAMMVENDIILWTLISHLYIQGRMKGGGGLGGVGRHPFLGDKFYTFLI